MPSPFPGMDPYLEDPSLWRGVHSRLINYAAEALQAALPPGFIADIDERLYVVEPERSIYPDIAVSKRPPERPQQEKGGGGTAVMDRGDPPGELTAYPVEIGEGFI